VAAVMIRATRMDRGRKDSGMSRGKHVEARELGRGRRTAPPGSVGVQASCTDHGRYDVANVNADVEAGCECTTPHGMLSVFAPA